MSSLTKDIKWTDDGLVPAIAQDWQSGEVLMMAWMNRESLLLTIERNEAVYFSRSRQALWAKGETSGHVQKVKSLRLDCDADVILLEVEQLGGIACHTGRRRCFYRQLENGQWTETDAVLKDPATIYGASDE
ncbi:MAG: phosphoribosyl-AMP cyclohydrolase [Pseudomonadales bacterium]